MISFGHFAEEQFVVLATDQNIPGRRNGRKAVLESPHSLSQHNLLHNGKRSVKKIQDRFEFDRTHPDAHRLVLNRDLPKATGAKSSCAIIQNRQLGFTLVERTRAASGTNP